MEPHKAVVLARPLPLVLGMVEYRSTGDFALANIAVAEVARPLMEISQYESAVVLEPHAVWMGV